MPRTRNILLTVALTGAALGSWFLGRHRGDEAPDGPVDTAHRGYYLDSARILGTADDGQLLYEIVAARAEQLPDNRIEFSDVSVNYLPQSDIPWTVAADSATIEQSRQRVILEGDVRATRRESDTETEIRAPYLELDPDTYIASTEARVEIRIGTRSLSATGMLASLKDNTLELKSNVSGTFFP